MVVCYSDQPPVLTNKSIFLAGPTKRDSTYASSWRRVAVHILEEIGFGGIVYVPEFEGRKKFDDKYIERQTRWEWDCLDVAGAILFWIPRCLPDMPAFTTNVEFGIYTEKKPDQVILGYPDYAVKMRYLDLRYNEVTGRTSHRSLQESLEEAVKLVENNYGKRDTIKKEQ